MIPRTSLYSFLVYKKQWLSCQPKLARIPHPILLGTKTQNFPHNSTTAHIFMDTFFLVYRFQVLMHRLLTVKLIKSVKNRHHLDWNPG